MRRLPTLAAPARAAARPWAGLLLVGFALGLALGSQVPATGSGRAEAAHGLAPGQDTRTPPACPTLRCPGCAGPRPAAEWLAEADAVFHGRVTAVEPEGCDQRLRFEVDTVWKGPATNRQSAWVGAMAWQCTRRYELGESYVVFARADPGGNLFLPMCFGIVDGDAREQLGPGSPVAPYQVAPVGHVGGRIQQLAADPGRPNLAWLAQGPRLAAVDLADPAAPRPLGAGLLLPGPVTGLAVDGPYAVARVGGRLLAVDLADPAAPRVVAEHDVGTLGDPGGPLALRGRLAAVPYIRAAEGRVNLAFLDILSGERRAELLAGFARLMDLVAVGDRLALGTGGGPEETPTLRVYPFDLASLTPGGKLPELGQLQDPAVERLAAARVAGAAEVAALSPRGLAAWDLTDPAAPRELRRCGAGWQGGGGPPGGDLALTGEGALYVARDQWVGSFYTAATVGRVVDAPAAGGGCASEPVHWTIRPLDARLRAQGERLLMAEAGGLGLYDAGRGEVARLDLVVDAVDVIAAELGGEPALLAASDQAGLIALGLAEPRAPEPREVLVGSGAERGGLTARAGIAGLASYGATDLHDRAIEVVDVQAPGTPARGARIHLLGAPSPLRYDQTGRRLVVRSAWDRVTLYDLSDPAAPVERGSVALEGRVSDLAVDGERVVVVHYAPLPADPWARTALQLTTLALLGEGGSLRLERRATLTVEPAAVVDEDLPRVSLAGGTAWLAGARGCLDRARFQLYGVDLANLDAPGLIPWSWEHLFARPLDILAAEGQVFLPGAETWVLDVRNPRLPAYAARLGPGRSVALAGRTVYLAMGPDGVGVYQPDLAWASDPRIPTPTPELIPSSLPPTPTAFCRPTPTPTPTEGAATRPPPSPTPICTPPPCPCGRLLGECPFLRCEPCTPTPPPVGRAYLPWSGNAAGPGPALSRAP